MDQFAITLNDAHIFRMTDDTGMFQHARFSLPNLTEGYTTDDNARALIMAVMLYEQGKKTTYLALVYRYLAFILHAQNENGVFRNFMTYGRQFTEKEGSEDCFGRCLWALSFTQASSVMPHGIKEACAAAILKALPNINNLFGLRGQAYAMIGLGHIEGSQAEILLTGLADSLISRFEHDAGDKDWQWFENSLTYDNAVLPWALFVAYRRLRQAHMLRVAQESLQFFDKISFRDGYFRAVGCKGWLLRGSKPTLYDEQPLEASTAALAHLAAYEATGEQRMLELAQQSFAWYLGNNSQNEGLIDGETGGCLDGITAKGFNFNQGAESIIGYCIANLALAKYKTDFVGLERKVILR
ncbi:MAG: glycosyltransferase [Dehalobacter sp. 4CP]|uniref:glycosyltransferase n=1 Tax=Dehalobacter sp. CP TaxID=2594474 RepID=UPI0013CC219C|nr:glycosyltransferase [Dehalobacter sp.]NBJ14497.1 glycosyltransferase [Dehalobacter sp. 4CP]